MLQLPLRQPAAVAKQATALQLLSGGRFVLGLGVGSHEGEYERAGVDFHRRGRLMDEGVAAAARGLGRPTATAPTTSRSRRRAPVPLWFGGASDAARRRAAAVGDGWVPLFLTPDDYAPPLAALRRETDEAGRDPDAVEPGVVVFACVGDDDAHRPRAPPGSRDLYRLPPKAFSATSSPARPTPVPPRCAATPRPGPATSS